MASHSDWPGRLDGPATRALAVVLLIVFAVEAAIGAAGDDAALLRFGALPDDGRLGHEYWRLIAYSFLHLTSVHLLLNLALLWWVGSIVERRIGGLLMCAAYFLAVIISGVSIVVAHLTAPRTGSSMGASGGVFGLLACALILLRRRDAAHVTAVRGCSYGSGSCRPRRLLPGSGRRSRSSTARCTRSSPSPAWATFPAS